ncbi:hypothetical protein N7474_003528 [Penicillium riverlandense]|uniref:uncharacterized protein n=1 Tax=Penicillium riverlandense TaxID=1903569 RepID=UPI00254662C7|nr:uncharacterized protein N7474_003528 [Penicillium riverlandense]KAJ5826390.1 hypothetical protein N7474_003528 [Penicillium riverlandense]
MTQPPPAFNLTELDHKLLAMNDADFVPHDWDDLKDIIARDDLGALKRRPSDLRRYLAWSRETKMRYGTVMEYICQRRLNWQSTPTSPAGSESEGSNSTATPTAAPAGTVFAFKNPVPFADPEDYKILRNDWPYGVSPGISHLVVWLRTPIAVKSYEGHLTDESRALIVDFVQKKFVARLAQDPERFPDPQSHVMWFKNWVGLQSVRALEHVHILVRDVPEEILVEWTGESAPEP